MTSVFVGGSRAISKLNDVIRKRLDDLTDRGCLILIGDANGADKMVQQYLAYKGYGDVVVYCMSHCRNNIAGWPTKNIVSNSRTRDFAYYASKDRAMAEAARCGVMFWDGVSKGTLNNIQNLISSGKKVLVYLSSTMSFVKLHGQADLDELLRQCDPRHIAAAQSQIARKLPPNKQLSLSPKR